MRNTVVHDYFPNNDATLKDLVLNTACLAQAIRRCLANHFHNHGGCLVPTSDVDSEYMGIKGESPYAAGYDALYIESSPSHDKETYLRTFTRNVITPC